MRANELKFSREVIKESSYSKFQDFHSLMRYRIQDILLVSSLYDSYIFEEDGRLYELIRREYQGLNLSHSPELMQCSSGEEALELVERENSFNLIITTQHIDDMHALTFAKKVRQAGLDIPIVLLGFDNRELGDMLVHPEISIFDKIFIWAGDYRIILGIIKFLEDKINVESDTKNVGVQSLILVEDSIRFYSSYLPIIYTELLKQSQHLISEGINLSHKFLRMRARPKILLCSTYEEAWDYYKKYENYILGIISDVDFSMYGEQNPQAGILLAQNIKKEHPDIPILLQSSVEKNKEAAYSVDASFILKGSPTLLQELRNFMVHNFSFGDFVFRDIEGDELGRASTLKQLEVQLKAVPDRSIIYHAERNHFSNWLKARTEFWLAHKLKPVKVDDFDSTKELRDSIINEIREFRTSRKRGVILDFNRESFDSSSTFARIGGGSLGGKARGLGFVNNLLSNFDIRGKFEGVEISVPPTIVIGTDIFDKFLDDNYLRDFALTSENDDELFHRFIYADKFPQGVIDDLRVFLSIIKSPLAVRSSSLLEDSQGQPFAGVYDTYMIPNNHEEIEQRLKQLLHMIKAVYASTFRQKAKDYIKVTTYRLEEEKMAVVIQKTIGAKHATRFYPELSGVAKSFNFYPTAPLKANDGIVSAALGFGKTIVEGGNAVRFCPKYPHHLLQFATIDDTLRYSQQEFFALDLEESDFDTDFNVNKLLKKYDLSVSEKDGTLYYTGSTYSQENDIIYDGISRQGVRIVTMASILKYHVFPLPEILELLLEMGSWGMGSPVEIEFAVNLSVPKGSPKEFGLLQIRPLVVNKELEGLDISRHKKRDLICSSEQVLGNGIVEDIKDIIFVDKDKFDRSKSRDVAAEISQLNSKLINSKRPYLLIGVGRWGTLDPWLGIPVTWEQISGAKAIVESNFKDFIVTPSQGTHFFQNLTSLNVGYFTVNNFLDKGFIDWAWLKKQKIIESKKYSKHIMLNSNLIIKINGSEGIGVIIKPSVNN
ncbi:MAG: histidine kinase [Ignavibacteriae bacterium]|nr:histidine kinase [Ignavibacteriota bacterium]NOG99933.1 histidine kinase [Ignavibacteriota bacterium]